MTRAVRAGRLLVPLAILAAIGANLTASVSEGTFVAYNFFGFFSNQANLIGAAALLIALPHTGRERARWVDLLRASATVYLIIVTSVYWLMLWPTAGDIAHPWANLIIHGVSCAAVLLDWMVEGPRGPVPLALVWVPLAYPALWVAVVLVRGATDGWIPYPFMDPASGYGAVAAVVGGIVVAGVVLSAVVFHLSRWRLVTPDQA